MALPIKDYNGGSGGGWFKADENKDAVAILVEVTGFQHQRPTDYGPKDSAITTMTVFNTEADLEPGSEVESRKGVRVEQTLLARDLEPLVGTATVVVLGQTQPKKAGQKPGWVWRAPSGEIKAKVVAWYEAKEAALEAAVAAAPSFDD